MSSFNPWVEKYRPKTVDEVVYQEEVVHALKKSLDKANLPHLLFYGPPGTGKTSTILAVAKQLFGPELYKSRVLELNASDERGINVIRTKVKRFAQISVGNVQSDKYPCPPFKIIILDEADSMTHDAQASLRRLMEQYSKVTRFCIICNYISRIIEPITSRCAKFRFKPLSKETIQKRMDEICKLEGVKITNETRDKIIDVCGGDLRRVITLLQSAVKMYDTKLNVENIIEISGVVPDKLVEEFYTSSKSNSFQKTQQTVSKIIKNGYSAKQLIRQLVDFIVFNKNISDLHKARICMQLGETEKCLMDGADEYLQLLNVSSFIMRLPEIKQE